MKPRILFVMHYLEIGGAETALIGLLNAIDYSRYDVDLFLHSHRGEMMAFVPKEVNLLPEIPIYAQIERPMKAVLKDGYGRMVLARLKAKTQTWHYKRHCKGKESYAGVQYTADAVTPMLPNINPLVEYDLAISFLQPHNIVRDKVHAKKKICWIHTDYSVVDVNAKRELPVWSAFDAIVSISDDVTKTYLQTFPSLESKIVLMENILSPTFVQNRAVEYDAIPELEKLGKGCNGLNILTIGRFCYQKNLDSIPVLCSELLKLLNKGESAPTSVKWFIIGYGEDEQLIRDKIVELGMENNVFVLGKRTNPYPYIKACDIYVQPSRYEGKAVTVREAQMLFKPVVVTNYPTASSQINDGVDGVIAPMDKQGCAEAIFKLIIDITKQEEIINYLRTHDYGNENEVRKIYSLI